MLSKNSITKTYIVVQITWLTEKPKLRRRNIRFQNAFHPYPRNLNYRVIAMLTCKTFGSKIAMHFKTPALNATA